MDIFKLSQSVEQFIYDVVMWVIFFPYSFVKIVRGPIGMCEFVKTELAEPNLDKRFASGMSPPLFLFFAIFLGWAWTPELSLPKELVANSKLLQLMTTNWANLIIIQLIIACAPPLVGALIMEWRTPGGITRDSFRTPFYQQAYICAPYMLFMKLLIGHKELIDEMTFGSATAIVAQCLLVLWFLLVQSRYFRRFAPVTLIQSLGFGSMVVISSYLMPVLFAVAIIL